MAPLLNIDVLAIACEFLTDVSDVLSMALTSSSVHPIAIRWLLHMCPVYLRSGPSICRFHFFLFADEPARAPHIRALHIDLRWPVPAQSRDEICSLLIHILEPCEHLERLTIAFQQESLPIIAEPSFLHAMTAIPSLKSFSVRSASFDGIMLLPHFRTPLCMIGIHTQYATVGTRCPATLKEFLPCAVVNTLENLELDRFAIEPLDAQTPDDVPIPSVFSMAPYPAMRSLSVDSFRGMPLLAHLQHLFPALDGTLHINQFHMWYRISEHVAVEIRARNQRSQDSDGGASRPWQKLDRVVCEAPMFYVLGLRCPIGLAMIHCGSVENYRYAAVALRENPVPRLKLTLYHELGMFEGLFSPELAGRLTHLTLCLLYSNIYEHSTSGRSQADTAANPQFQWQDVLVCMQAPPHLVPSSGFGFGVVALIIFAHRATPLFSTGHAHHRPPASAETHAPPHRDRRERIYRQRGVVAAPSLGRVRALPPRL